MALTRIRAQQISNIDYKQSVRVVTTTNITLAGGAPNTVDGVSLVINNRILVTGQTTGSQNGLYYVTTVGTGSNGTWTRSSDADATGEIDAGMIVMVTEGTVYADTQWKLTTNDPITIGSTALTFVQNYLANSISAGTSNVTVGSSANVTISSAGTANVFTVSSTGTVVSGTESVTGNITGGNIRTAGLVSATGSITGSSVVGGVITGTSTSVTGNITGGNLITGGSITATGIATSTGVILTPWNLGATNIATVGGGATASGRTLLGWNRSSGGGEFDIIVNRNGGSTGGLSLYEWANTLTDTTTLVFNVTAAGAVSATGNITGANLNTAGLVSATGNIQGGNLRTAGLISATGSITGASVVGGVMTGSSVSVTGAVTGASTVGGIITGTSTSVTGTTTAASVVGGVITGTSTSVTGTTTAASVVGGVITGSSVSVTGAVTGASLVGTIITAAQNNITSVGTLSSLSVSGNVQAGNISTTTAVISANTTSAALQITQVGTGNALLVEDSANPDATPTVIDASGNVGIGISPPVAKLDVYAASGYVDARVRSGSNQTYVATDGSASYFGTYSNIPIIFSTNNINRGGISAAGVWSLGAPAGAESLRVTPTANAVNYLTVTGATVGTTPTITVQGSDTNIPFALTTKGSGGALFYTNNFGQLQFVVGHTASAVNYLQASGGSASNGVTLSAQGTDTNINITLTPKGSGNVNTGANVSATGNITGNYFIGNGSQLTGVVGENVVLNDISNQFDNVTSVFALKNEQANVTNIVDSRNLQVVVGGQPLSPYVTLANWPFVGPFFTPYDSYRGFRVKSDSVSSNVIIYNSPAIGDQATITIINNSTTVQTRRYPYSPETIALGD